MSEPCLLLDTNTVSYLMSGRSPAVRGKYAAAREQGQQLAMSSITAAEILYGIERRSQSVRLAAAFEVLCQTIAVLPWDFAAARSYGRLRRQLEASGKSLESEDMLIAAHAHALDATLVTRDRDFGGIAGLLRIENWATDI